MSLCCHLQHSVVANVLTIAKGGNLALCIHHKGTISCQHLQHFDHLHSLYVFARYNICQLLISFKLYLLVYQPVTHGNFAYFGSLTIAALQTTYAFAAVLIAIKKNKNMYKKKIVFWLILFCDLEFNWILSISMSVNVKSYSCHSWVFLNKHQHTHCSFSKPPWYRISYSCVSVLSIVVKLRGSAVVPGNKLRWSRN